MSCWIVTDHDFTASRVKEVLSFGGGPPGERFVTIADADRAMAGEEVAERAILVLPPDPDRAPALIPSLSRAAQGRLIVAGPVDDPSLILRALRSGVADYVDSGDLEVELRAALDRLATAVVAKKSSGRILAVLGPNGGAGSSLVAVNLAVGLAKDHGGVGLLDLKLETGDLAAMLDLKPTFTLSDLCKNAARLDRVMFERSLVKHGSGVHLLAPPLELAEVEAVRSAGFAEALTLARESFPYVVADVDHSFGIDEEAVLQRADAVLLVLRLDFSSLRNAHRAVTYLRRVGVADDVIRVVVNRRGQPSEIPASKAEEALGLKIAHSIPEDAKAVNRATNNGVPVLLGEPRSKVARSLARLAESFRPIAARELGFLGMITREPIRHETRLD